MPINVNGLWRVYQRMLVFVGKYLTLSYRADLTLCRVFVQVRAYICFIQVSMLITSINQVLIRTEFEILALVLIARRWPFQLPQSQNGFVFSARADG